MWGTIRDASSQAQPLYASPTGWEDSEGHEHFAGLESKFPASHVICGICPCP